MTRGLMLLAGFLVSGCALGSGVAPVGPGLFGVTEMRAPVRGGGVEARRAVLADARGYCARAGQRMELLELRPGGDPRIAEWPTAFGAVFRCE